MKTTSNLGAHSEEQYDDYKSEMVLKTQRKTKYKILPLGRHNQFCRQGGLWLSALVSQKHVGIRVNKKLDASQRFCAVKTHWYVGNET